tara:strand:+ start:5240 stop:5623 length:384 start_codon:yes stop_codon:yes gene_type:complete
MASLSTKALSLAETRATQIRTKLEKIIDRYNTKEHGDNKRWYITIGGAGAHGCDAQVYANEDGSVSVSLDDYGIVGCIIAESVKVYDLEVVECEGVGEALISMLNKPARKNADAQPWSSSCWHICWN